MSEAVMYNTDNKEEMRVKKTSAKRWIRARTVSFPNRVIELPIWVFPHLYPHFYLYYFRS